MKYFLAAVSLPVLLAACASPGERRAAPEQATTPRSAAASAAAPRAASRAVRPASGTALATKKPAPAPEEKLPNVELSDKLLVDILAAEIAAKRGDWQASYARFMSAARLTRDPRLAHRAVEVALGARRTDEALAAVRLWRTLAPASEEAAQYLLGFAILSNNFAEARPILEQRLADAPLPTRGAAMLQVQRLLARAPDKAGAFTLLQTLVTPYSSTAESHVALALAAFNAADPGRAMREARLALEAQPDSSLAVLTLARVTPDKKAAMAALEEFLKQNPAARDVRIAHAKLLAEDKQYDRARAEFERMLKDDPKDLTALFALGVLDMQSGRRASAERYLEDYIDGLSADGEEERDPTQALLLLAQLAEDRNDLPTAIAWLDRIEPGEAWLPAQIRRAELIAKNGDVEGAREALARIDTHSPEEEVQVALAQARILRAAKRPQDAYEAMHAVAEKYPSNVDVLYEFALMAEKVGRHAEMESTLRRIIKLAPDNYQAYNALGYSLADRGVRLQEALSLIEKAVKLAPSDPFIMDSLGWVQFRLGRLDDAERTLRRAYTLQPDAEIGVHLGEVLWTRGEHEKAQQLWREAKAKDPHNDALKDTLSRLHVSL